MENFIEFKKLNMKERNDIDEAMIQDMIAENPQILGLGDLVLKDKERVQNGAGRLDILLQDLDSSKRYEVEIQLGKLDESHIIRTIEYWDIEKRRYPQYEHCAVIIAEDITSRFLNIIQLFNGHIPIIAIQMNAYEVDGKRGVIFTKVIDEISLGLEDEETDYEVANREYWELRSSIDAMSILDSLRELIISSHPQIDFKYTKHYVGVAEHGVAKNFIVIRVKKKFIRVELKLDRSEEIDERFDNSDIDFMGYANKEKRYKFRLIKDDVKKNENFLKELVEMAYASW